MYDGETEEIVSKAYIASLLEKAKFLQALEAAGVDNWEGYDYAQDLMSEWEEDE